MKTLPTGATQEFFYSFDNKMLVDQPPTSPNTGSSYTIEDYLYLAGTPVAAFRSLWVASGGTFVRQSTSDSSSTLCEKFSDGGKCGLYHLVTDLQQRPVLMVRDSSKEITQAVSYDAFGNVNRIPVIAGANNNQVQDLATIRLPPGTSRIRARANYVVAPSNVITLDGQTIYSTSNVPRIYTVSPWVIPSSTSVHLSIPTTFPGGPGDGPGIQNDSVEFMRGSSAMPLFTNLRGPGQYYDAEHDLFENWHRYLDPKTGRYLSPEPLAQSPVYLRRMAQAGMIVPTYGYAANNPLRFMDPTGTEVVGWFDRSTGQLSLMDRQSHATASMLARSGRANVSESVVNEGPIPLGFYEILYHPNDDFWRLDALDTKWRDDTHNATGRKYFRLHKLGGGRNTGCIGASVEATSGGDYAAVRQLLDQTSVSVVQAPYEKEMATLKYGEIYVFESSAWGWSPW